jgi:hypothetical protein
MDKGCKIYFRRNDMKSFITKGLSVILIYGLFSFIGCSSTPVSYSFAKDEANSASINFIRRKPDVTFLYYNNEILPEPESKTYWDPILFPSGVPLEIMVHAYYGQDAFAITDAGLLVAIISSAITSAIAASRFVDIDVLFTCPPLEAGKKYSLAFRKEAGTPGRNRLILTDIAARRIIYQQEFPALFQKAHDTLQCIGLSPSGGRCCSTLTFHVNFDLK